MPWLGSHGPMECLRVLREWTAAGAGEGDLEGSSPRKEGPCGARRSLAGDERQVVPFQSGALNAT